MSKVIAPFVPFMAEEIYQNLVVNNVPGAPESVHLCDFPDLRQPPGWTRTWKSRWTALLAVVQLGRACRNAANMKVRQPAAALYVKGAQLRERITATCARTS